MLWSFLMATVGGWIAPLLRSGAAFHTSTAATSRQAAYDVDAPAIPPAPSVVFARAHAGAPALSVVTIGHHASTPPHPMRRFVARSAVPRHRRVPLYGLFRVYRI
jgi:hypothetical protein